MVRSNQVNSLQGFSERSGESWGTRWSRRCLTIPAYVALGSLTLVLLPFLVLIATIIDVVWGRRFGSVRCVLALALYVVCEAIGLLVSLALWIGNAVLADGSHDRFSRWNADLQNLWARTLFHGAVRIFGMRSHVEDADFGADPIFVFIRHASTIDTLLAAVFVEQRHSFRLRYIMKRELLWDPCLDIVGQRQRHLFVRRRSGDSAREIANVRDLAVDLSSREGVLLYPEGTRATPEKRARIVRRMAEAGDQRRLDAATALRHTLPPRVGGALALLEARPDVGVLFIAHVGFDGVESLRDLWQGALVGRELRVMMWKVAASDIPATSSERVAWLDREWAKIDRWVGAHLPAGPGRPDGDPGKES